MWRLVPGTNRVPGTTLPKRLWRKYLARVEDIQRVEGALDMMERFVNFGEMKLVGKLGVAAGMQDVRDLKNFMDEARELGAKLKEALSL